MINRLLPRGLCDSLLLILLAALITTSAFCQPRGQIRSSCPDGWQSEEFPGDGFRFNVKKELQKGPPVLGIDAGLGSRWEPRLSFRNSDEILAFMRERHPELTQVQKLSIDGFEGYLVHSVPAFHAGGYGEGFFNSKYGFLGRAVLAYGEACVSFHFDAYAVGEYTNANQAEVIAEGQKVVSQTQSIIAALRIDYTPPGGKPPQPAMPVKDKEEPESQWLTVVGAGAAGMLLLAAAAALLSGKRNPQDSDQPVSDYILQLSQDLIELKYGAAGTCEATVWEVRPGYAHGLATSARISISSVSGSGIFKVDVINSPARATFTFSPTTGAAEGKEVFIVQAQAGASTHKAELTVVHTSELQLCMLGSREKELYQIKSEEVFVIRQNQETGDWNFGNIDIFFNSSETGTLAAPPANVQFSPPTIESQGPFEVSAITPLNESSWQCQVRLKPGEKPDPAWLFADGLIHVKVTCTAEGGTSDDR